VVGVVRSEHAGRDLVEVVPERAEDAVVDPGDIGERPAPVALGHDLVREGVVELPPPAAKSVDQAAHGAPLARHRPALQRKTPLNPVKASYRCKGRHQGLAMKINDRAIGPDHPPLVIAEIGINHGGDL
jgi:hypothetical protein